MMINEIAASSVTRSLKQKSPIFKSLWSIWQKVMLFQKLHKILLYFGQLFLNVTAKELKSDLNSKNIAQSGHTGCTHGMAF